MLTCSLERQSDLGILEFPPQKEIEQVSAYLQRVESRKYAVDPERRSTIFFQVDEKYILLSGAENDPAGYRVGVQDASYMPLAYEGMGAESFVADHWFSALPSDHKTLWEYEGLPRETRIECIGFAPQSGRARRALERAMRMLTGHYPNTGSEVRVYPVKEGYGTGTLEEATLMRELRRSGVGELPWISLQVDGHRIAGFPIADVSAYQMLLHRLFALPPYWRTAIQEHPGSKAHHPHDICVDSFEGRFDFLSNYADSELVFEGRPYPSVENAFQAAKTLNPADRRLFQTCSSDQAKRLGRKLKLRDDWEEVRITVMRTLLQTKFAREPFREQLLATGDALLVEGNWWGDQFWGVSKDQGKNWLGLLLMEIRKGLASECDDKG